MSRTPCASSGWIRPPDDRRLVEDAEHARDVGPVDVGVHEADREALLRQRDREVGGDGGLAHPALARRDRDDPAQVRLRHRAAAPAPPAAPAAARPAGAWVALGGTGGIDHA